MVTLTSTEAETYAAVEATKDIVYFRAILKELGVPSSDRHLSTSTTSRSSPWHNNSRVTTNAANTFWPASTT